MLIGTAAHSLLLTGSAEYEEEFGIGGRAEGADRLTDEHRRLVARLATDVSNYPPAREILARSEPELVGRWTDWATGLPCQMRLDILDGVRHEGGDLKTTSSLTKFPKQIKSLKYIEQAAFYEMGYQAITGEPMRRYPLVVVDKTEGLEAPVAIHEIESESRESMKPKLRQSLDNLARWLDQEGITFAGRPPQGRRR